MAHAVDTPQRSSSARASFRRDELVDDLVDLFIRKGFLGQSIEDIAREVKCSKSTLYTVADSKEQMFAAVARAFFRRATARIEQRLNAADARANRIASYLIAISIEFASASPRYFSDLDAFAPTREIYRANLDAASVRMQELVLEAVPQASQSDARFLGTVAALMMEAIHRGEIEHSAGLDHPAAYRSLGNLIAAGVTASAQQGRL